jgi:hypothetical protein
MKKLLSLITFLSTLRSRKSNRLTGIQWIKFFLLFKRTQMGLIICKPLSADRQICLCALAGSYVQAAGQTD